MQWFLFDFLFCSATSSTKCGNFSCCIHFCLLKGEQWLRAPKIHPELQIPLFTLWICIYFRIFLRQFPPNWLSLPFLLSPTPRITHTHLVPLALPLPLWLSSQLLNSPPHPQASKVKRWAQLKSWTSCTSWYFKKMLNFKKIQSFLSSWMRFFTSPPECSWLPTDAVRCHQPGWQHWWHWVPTLTPPLCAHDLKGSFPPAWWPWIFNAGPCTSIFCVIGLYILCY